MHFTMSLIFTWIHQILGGDEVDINVCVFVEMCGYVEKGNYMCANDSQNVDGTHVLVR